MGLTIRSPSVHHGSNGPSWLPLIRKMLDFVFDEITDLQRAEILIAARMEDLKRTGHSTQRDGEVDINHTNDEDDMNKARGCLSLISPDVYAEYLKAREVLGYV